MANPTIVFFGTPEFAVIVLRILIEQNLAPVLLVAPPDQPIGRKKILTPPPTKMEAEKHGIDVVQPEHVTDLEEQIRQLTPDLIILAAYGHLIPQSMLDIPLKGSLNVHPSLLPKYRGPSPVQTAILKGEDVTGVTIMLMDGEIDHGPIVAQEILPTPLSSLVLEQAKKELGVLGGNLLVKTIPQWIKGEITAVPQDHEHATYTEHLTRDHGIIDWTRQAVEIERQVRALNPWPGTFTFADAKRLKVLEVRIGEKTTEKPGTAKTGSDHTLAIAAKDRDILITRLQVEGKNPMSAKEFLLGNKKFIGKVLG